MLLGAVGGTVQSALQQLSAAKPLHATACCFCTFALGNLALQKTLGPRAAVLLGADGRANKLGIFINHTITMLHAALAATAVLCMVYIERGLSTLEEEPLAGQVAGMAGL